MPLRVDILLLKGFQSQLLLMQLNRRTILPAHQKDRSQFPL